MMNDKRHAGSRYVLFDPRDWRTYVVAVPLAIGAVVFAVFFFAVFLALFTVAAIGFGLRLWWLRRRHRPGAPPPAGGTPLKGEYTVVEDRVERVERSDRRR